MLNYKDCEEKLDEFIREFSHIVNSLTEDELIVLSNKSFQIHDMIYQKIYKE